MKRIGVAATAIFTLVAVAVAIAAQTNVYGVTASTSPTKAGTAKKPVGLKLNFNYTVDEIDGKRPAAIKKYSIDFNGIRVNGKKFKKCSADQINSTGDPATDSACPKDALVGTGSIVATVGSSDKEEDQSLNCFQTLKVYNAPNRHATLFLEGKTPPEGYGFPRAGDEYCVINFGKAIDARYVQDNSGTALEFVVPDTVLHNVPGTTTAVRKVQSTIKRRYKLVRGKRQYYYESRGGCTKKGRAVTVSFTAESGITQKAQTFAKCTR
ncbi:MAG: hypothetical protein ABIO51_04490 [Solirubrobacteraceae bacterium]